MTPHEHLEWMLSRRSVRSFAPRPVERAVLERLMVAATSAPSNTNRQPWRFAVVTSTATRAAIASAVKTRADEIKAIIRRGPHAEDFGNYSDFFHEPLEAAAAIVIPQYRDYPDLIANLIESGGGDPRAFSTASAMQAELCSTSAACMNLLLQAHAEGLGAVWMAGPTIARPAISALLDIAPPWHMVGAIAIGHLDGPRPAAPPRKPLDRVVMWFDDDKEPA
jgi:coenzyme F420-0:L-glutamate ligase/coenzyme F420-1:gamma-L-glutamate ligase